MLTGRFSWTQFQFSEPRRRARQSNSRGSQVRVREYAVSGSAVSRFLITVVMNNRPAIIREIVDVDLPRPRNYWAPIDLRYSSTGAASTPPLVA